MPNYRRDHIPGGTFFFTVVTHRRRKLFHLEDRLRLHWFEKGKSVGVTTERVP